MKKARVLYVIGTLDVGGAERQMAELASRLDRKRFDVSVCALTSGGPVEKTLEAAGISVTIIGIRGLYKNFSAASLLRIPAALWRLRRFIRRGRFDVVHGILFHAYVLAALMGRRRRPGCPRPIIVTSRRGLDLEIKSKAHYRWVARAANRRTDLVVANSQAVKLATVEAEGLAADRIVVIPNGIDLVAFDSLARLSNPEALRASLGLAGASPVVGMVANFNKYKDHDTFLAAAAPIARDFPGARFLLVGTGPTRAGFEARLAVDHGLADRFVILGSRRDIPALLGALDIFVLSSREEGFPNAVLEAMAAAKPVVAAAVGGVPEAVRDGATGLLVPPGDAAALAAAVVRLAADPGLARAMGAAGRAAVERELGMARMVTAYESLYEGLLAHLPEKPEKPVPSGPRQA